MRTALFLVATMLAEIASSIMKVNGMYEKPGVEVNNFIITLFVLFIVMDLVDFARGKK